MHLYLPLVEALAHRHDRRGAEHDDLVQAGSIGLLNAIERYDPGRGGEFAAFAVPTIAGEMKRHLRDRTAAVRLPRRLQEASARVPVARATTCGRSWAVSRLPRSWATRSGYPARRLLRSRARAPRPWMRLRWRTQAIRST